MQIVSAHLIPLDSVMFARLCYSACYTPEVFPPGYVILSICSNNRTGPMTGTLGIQLS